MEENRIAIGVVGWISAVLVNSPYGMAIIPEDLEIVDLEFSWGLLYVIGIPIGFFWGNRNNNEKYFIIPIANIVVKWMLGGLGLGIT